MQTNQQCERKREVQKKKSKLDYKGHLQAWFLGLILVADGGVFAGMWKVELMCLD